MTDKVEEMCLSASFESKMVFHWFLGAGFHCQQMPLGEPCSILISFHVYWHCVQLHGYLILYTHHCWPYFLSCKELMVLGVSGCILQNSRCYMSAIHLSWVTLEMITSIFHGLVMQVYAGINAFQNIVMFVFFIKLVWICIENIIRKNPESLKYRDRIELFILNIIIL